MRLNLPVESEWLSVDALDQPKPKIDREKNIIHGVIIAEVGELKDGRGYFSEQSLHAGIALANQKPHGLKSRLQHQDLSDDGTAKFLGRQKNNRFENGKWLADMHIDDSAFVSPAGNLGEYVMTRAESDSDSFGTSLVGQFDFFDTEGKQLDRNEMHQAQEKTPGKTHWIPTKIHSSDVVDTPAATNSFLAEEHLLDRDVRAASRFMDGLFEDQALFDGQSREVVESRCRSYLTLYFDHRQYGENKMKTPDALLVDPFAKTDLVPTGEKTKPDALDASDLPTDSVVQEKSSQELIGEIVNDAPAAAVLEESKNINQAAADRAAEISQLCLLAGCSSKAAPLIANLKLSAADVRSYLASKVSLDNALSSDVTVDPGEKEELTQDDKDEVKYNLNKEHYLKHEVSLERFKISEEVERNNGFVKPTPAVVLQ